MYLFRDLITSKICLLYIFGIEIQAQLYFLGSIFGTVIHCSARQFYVLSVFGIEIQVQLYFLLSIFDLVIHRSARQVYLFWLIFDIGIQ